MNLQNQIEYLKEYTGTDMFDNCSVPSPLDMARVRGAIVMRCGLLTPLFSEPETQRDATQQFFFENQWNFEHIIKILQAEYSPIENVAEWRTESTRGTGADSLTISRTGNEAHSGTDARTISEDATGSTQESGNTSTQESGTTQTERTISAENANDYQPDNMETVTHLKGEAVTHGKKTDESDKKTTLDDFTHGHNINTSGQDTHKRDTENDTQHEMNRHGNIGVTTNQDLMNQELDLLERFNPYRFIADLYEKELMLGLY